MQPTAVQFDKSTEMGLIHLTLVNKNGAVAPPKGTYNCDPKSIREIPDLEKAAKYVF